MAKCRPGIAKSCDKLFSRNRRMHPLNWSYFDVNSTKNDSWLSTMPPIYIVLLMRRGIFKFSSSISLVSTLWHRMVSCLLMRFNVIRCQVPSFSRRDKIDSIRLRPRAITLSWPFRRITAKKCLGFSFVPCDQKKENKSDRCPKTKQNKSFY